MNKKVYIVVELFTLHDSNNDGWAQVTVVCGLLSEKMHLGHHVISTQTHYPLPSFWKEL